MIKFKPLNLNKCKTNKEVVEKISKRAKEVDLKDLTEYVGEVFIHQEESVAAILTGLMFGMNTYLHGKGGYGKTAVTSYILDALNIPYSVINGYKDMPVEALLGVPNMKKLLDDSQYELNFKDSIFRTPGVLIGEEFGDILPATAAALKDILSEKGFRDGTSKIESLISSMIITTNTAPSALSDDESKRAFYEGRFPIKVEVKWGSHMTNDYFELFVLKKPEANRRRLHFLAVILDAHNKKGGYIVTPRKALEVLEGFLILGSSSLATFSINTDKLDSMRVASKLELERKTAEDLLNVYLKWLEDSISSELAGYILATISGIQIQVSVIKTYNKVKDKCIAILLDNFENIPQEVIDSSIDLQDYDTRT